MGLIWTPDGGVAVAGEGSGPDVATIAPEELEALVREAIARNKKARRGAESQRLMDLTIEALADEGEIALASALLLLMAHRVTCTAHVANQVLWQLAFDMNLPRPRV